jgi:HEAT repeat protein
MDSVPTFTRLLTDRRPGIRRLAAEGLGKIGGASQTALPALRQALQDRDDRVREAATQAIELIHNVDAPMFFCWKTLDLMSGNNVRFAVDR